MVGYGQIEFVGWPKSQVATGAVRQEWLEVERRSRSPGAWRKSGIGLFESLRLMSFLVKVILAVELQHQIPVHRRGIPRRAAG